eukprot:2692507-Prymnesium_polylepis.2
MNQVQTLAIHEQGGVPPRAGGGTPGVLARHDHASFVVPATDEHGPESSHARGTAASRDASEMRAEGSVRHPLSDGSGALRAACGTRSAPLPHPCRTCSTADSAIHERADGRCVPPTPTCRKFWTLRAERKPPRRSARVRRSAAQRGGGGRGGQHPSYSHPVVARTLPGSSL